MNDHDALRAAVVAEPDDDLPRLAFADWCEENGHEVRAGYVRLSLEAHRLAPACRCERCRLGNLRGDCSCDPAWLAMKNQIAAVLNSGHHNNGRLWAGDPLARIHGARFDYRRGFVWRIHLPLGEWARHGKVLAATHPLGYVQPTDLMTEQLSEYADYSFYFQWQRYAARVALISMPEEEIPFGEAVDLAEAIDRETAMVRYDSEEEAHYGMSRAMLDWAKGRAR